MAKIWTRQFRHLKPIWAGRFHGSQQDRDFVGRDILISQKAAGTDKLVGLVMREKGVLRAGQKVTVAGGEGVHYFWNVFRQH